MINPETKQTSICFYPWKMNYRLVVIHTTTNPLPYISRSHTDGYQVPLKSAAHCCLGSGADILQCHPTDPHPYHDNPCSSKYGSSNETPDDSACTHLYTSYVLSSPPKFLPQRHISRYFCALHCTYCNLLQQNGKQIQHRLDKFISSRSVLPFFITNFMTFLKSSTKILADIFLYLLS